MSGYLSFGLLGNFGDLVIRHWLSISSCSPKEGRGFQVNGKHNLWGQMTGGGYLLAAQWVKLPLGSKGTCLLSVERHLRTRISAGTWIYPEDTTRLPCLCHPCLSSWWMFDITWTGPGWANLGKILLGRKGGMPYRDSLPNTSRAEQRQCSLGLSMKSPRPTIAVNQGPGDDIEPG